MFCSRSHTSSRRRAVRSTRHVRGAQQCTELLELGALRWPMQSAAARPRQGPGQLQRLPPLDHEHGLFAGVRLEHRGGLQPLRERALPERALGAAAVARPAAAWRGHRARSCSAHHCAAASASAAASSQLSASALRSGLLRALPHNLDPATPRANGAEPARGLRIPPAASRAGADSSGAHARHDRGAILRRVRGSAAETKPSRAAAARSRRCRPRAMSLRSRRAAPPRPARRRPGCRAAEAALSAAASAHRLAPQQPFLGPPTAAAARSRRGRAPHRVRARARRSRAGHRGCSRRVARRRAVRAE